MKCYKITEKTGNVVGVLSVDKDSEVMLITTEGIIIRIAVNDISELGRITSGVKLINLDVEKDIRVASIAKVRESEKTSEDDLIKTLEQEFDSEEDTTVENDTEELDTIYDDTDTLDDEVLEDESEPGSEE